MTSSPKSDRSKTGKPGVRKSVPPGSRNQTAGVHPARESAETIRLLERAAADSTPQKYLLRLYVTGATPASVRAIARVRSVCEENLHGLYDLEVIDIYQKPSLAKDEQIIATPTLVKVLPSPLRRFIGDLSRVEKVLFGIDFRERH